MSDGESWGRARKWQRNKNAKNQNLKYRYMYLLPEPDRRQRRPPLSQEHLERRAGGPPMSPVTQLPELSPPRLVPRPSHPARDKPSDGETGSRPSSRPRKVPVPPEPSPQEAFGGAGSCAPGPRFCTAEPPPSPWERAQVGATAAALPSRPDGVSSSRRQAPVPRWSAREG